MFILYPTIKYFIYNTKDKSSYRSIGPGDVIQYKTKDNKCDVLVLGINKEVTIESIIDGEYIQKNISLREFEDMVYPDYLCDTEFKQDWLLYSVEQKAYYSIGDTFSIFSLTKGIGKTDVTFSNVIRGNIGTSVYLTYQNDKHKQIVLNNPEYVGRLPMKDVTGIPFYDDYVAVSSALNQPNTILL